MSAVEVIGAEVLVERAVLEHVVDGAQEGGGDGANGFLGASAALDAVELGLEIAALGSDGCPGAREEGCFQPA